MNGSSLSSAAIPCNEDGNCLRGRMTSFYYDIEEFYPSGCIRRSDITEIGIRAVGPNDWRIREVFTEFILCDERCALLVTENQFLGLIVTGSYQNRRYRPLTFVTPASDMYYNYNN